MHTEVASPQLFGGAQQGNDVAMFRAVCRTFAVDCLRTGYQDLLDRQLVIADDLQHLGRAEAIDEDVLRHLGHVAAVCCFVKDNIDVS
jgi:hypothetical protein